MVNTRSSFPAVAIVAGVRTPFVRSQGALRDTGADELGTVCLRELVQRTGINPAEVDDVVIGCVGQPPDAMNIARVIALRAGFPVTVSASTVHRNCASSFEAITTAWERIVTGQAEVVVAGGTESMSNMPVMANPDYVRLLEKMMGTKSTWGRLRALLGFRPRMLAVHPAILDGLTDKTCGLIMGLTAENLARDFRIPRDEQDAWALESHRRLTRAWTDLRLRDEVMPMYPAPKREPLTQDVGYRPNQTMDALAKLKPYFDRKYGSVTVGNSCPITDGAAMLLMMPLERAKAEGREVLGVLESFAWAGVAPDRMGLGPVFASSKALDDAGMTLADMELIELNEAFSAQVLACLRAFESDTFAKERLGRKKAMGVVDRNRLNVNGGAIALGHPVGATGGRLVLTLLNEMKQRNLERGLATLCIGGGMGGALVFSRNVDASKPKLFPKPGELAPEPTVPKPAEAPTNGNGAAAAAKAAEAEAKAKAEAEAKAKAEAEAKAKAEEEAKARAEAEAKAKAEEEAKAKAEAEAKAKAEEEAKAKAEAEAKAKAEEEAKAKAEAEAKAKAEEEAKAKAEAEAKAKAEEEAKAKAEAEAKAKAEEEAKAKAEAEAKAKAEEEAKAKAEAEAKAKAE
ncbi:MAG: acetyl-CoA C-acyltransferase, partial [Planctomycetota bacterium]